MSDAAQHVPRHLWWTLAGLTLAWGFNWTALKVGLSEIEPFTFRSVCLGAGAGVLFAVLRANGQPLGIPRSQWGRLALIALFSVTLWNVLIAYGVRLIPSGRAAILAYTMPAWSIPLSAWMLGEKIGSRRVVGLALGMAGMSLLLWDEVANLSRAPLGALLILLAALGWACGTILQKKYPVTAPLPAYTAWIMIIGGIPIFVCAAVFDLGDLLSGNTRAPGAWAIVALLYNVFVSFAWAHWAWIKLVTSLPVGVFSISMLMTPVVGVFSGILFLGERPSWLEFGALILVLCSLLSVMLPRRRS